MLTRPTTSVKSSGCLPTASRYGHFIGTLCGYPRRTRASIPSRIFSTQTSTVSVAVLTTTSRVERFFVWIVQTREAADLPGQGSFVQPLGISVDAFLKGALHVELDERGQLRPGGLAHVGVRRNDGHHNGHAVAGQQPGQVRHPLVMLFSVLFAEPEPGAQLAEIRKCRPSSNNHPGTFPALKGDGFSEPTALPQRSR